MPPLKSDASSRLGYIDLLRGIACVIVLLYHAREYGLLPDLNRLDPLVQPLAGVVSGVARRGYLGVHLFLVLSGFCLMWPLARRGTVSEMRLDLREFARRRARRILPPYYVALGLCLALVLVPDLPLSRPTLWWDIPVHLLMIHNCFSETSWTINGSFWSLGLEVQLYAAFPVALLVARKYGLRRLLVGSLLLALLWKWLMWEEHPNLTNFGMGAATFYALPGRLFEFICGMVAAVCVARHDPKLAQRASRLAPVILALAFIVTTEQPSQFGCWSDSLWGAGFALSIVVLGFSLSSEAIALPRKPAQLLMGLGTVSYSIYLLHQPLLQLAASKIVVLGLPPALLFVLTLVVVLPFLVCAGRVFYRLVEAPQQFRKPKPQRSLIKSKTISEQPGSPS